MQTGILVGLVIMLLAVGSFLLYYIAGALPTEDASKVDEVPDNHLNV